MKTTREVIFSMVIFILNIIILLYTYNLADGDLSPTSPFILPAIAMSFALILNTIILLKKLSTMNILSIEDKFTHLFNKINIMMILLTVLYIIVMYFTNFRVATILFLCMTMSYLKVNMKITHIFIVAFTTTYWLVFIFEYLFKTMLP